MEELAYNQPTTTPLDEKAQRRQKIEKWLTELLIYLGVFLVTLFLFLTVKPFIQLQRKGAVAQSIIVLGFVAIFLFAAYMGITKRLTATHVIVLLLIANFCAASRTVALFSTI